MGVKLIIVFCAIVVGTMGGLALQKNQTRRTKYFRDFINLITVIIGEVKFRQAKIKDILSSFQAANQTPISAVITEYLTAMDTNQDLKNFLPAKTKLKDNERELVREFFVSLGTSDCQTEIFMLENFNMRFDEIYQMYEARDKKYGSLYIKLGFFVGLALGIILL